MHASLYLIPFSNTFSPSAFSLLPYSSLVLVFWCWFAPLCKSENLLILHLMKHKEEKTQISTTVVTATLETLSSLRLVNPLPQLSLILPYFQCSVTISEHLCVWYCHARKKKQGMIYVNTVDKLKLHQILDIDTRIITRKLNCNYLEQSSFRAIRSFLIPREEEVQTRTILWGKRTTFAVTLHITYWEKTLIYFWSVSHIQIPVFLFLRWQSEIKQKKAFLLRFTLTS